MSLLVRLAVDPTLVSQSVSLINLQFATEGKTWDLVMSLRNCFLIIIRVRAINPHWLTNVPLRFRVLFSFYKPSYHKKTLSPFCTLSIKSLISSFLLGLTTLLFWTYPTSNRSTRSSESWALIGDFKSSNLNTHKGLIFLEVKIFTRVFLFFFSLVDNFNQ